MLDFRPPKHNPFLVGFFRTFRFLIRDIKMEQAEIRVVADGLERFNKLKGKHCMICPNHSHRHDPETMFLFSCMVKEDFNYIAAREVFDWNNGLNGWFLQNAGAYSVVRGAVDRESFKMTKKILVEGKKKLVLFPEGEISRQNDILLPLESGAVQLGFMALDELHKTQAEEPLYILPVAIKYTYKNDLTQILNKTISKIESKIGIDNSNEASLYKRVRAASDVVLKTLEEEYGYKAAPDAELNHRMKELKAHILKKIADLLAINLPATDNLLDQVRIIRNHIDDFLYSDENHLPPYQKKIHEEKADKIRAFYHDLDRVVSFVAIYEGYLSPPISQERMVNVIELLENEVFGGTNIKGPRLVLLTIGNPINLLEHYAEYKKNKKALVEKLRAEMSQQLFTMLSNADKDRKTVFVD